MARYNCICDVVQAVIEEADECLETCKKAGRGKDKYAEAQLIAYNTCLSIMQSSFIGEEDLEKLLDFDIDKRYL